MCAFFRHGIGSIAISNRACLVGTTDKIRPFTGGHTAARGHIVAPCDHGQRRLDPSRIGLSSPQSVVPVCPVDGLTDRRFVL